jgi:phage replication O-like protein O
MSVPPPNYTQLPNVLLDAMCELSDAELRVALAICRKTFGWHKERDTLSLSQLEQVTGRSRPSTIAGVNGLIERGWIERTPATKRGGKTYVYRLCVEAIYPDEQSPSSDTAAYQYSSVPVQQRTAEPVQQRTSAKQGKPRPDAENGEVVRYRTSTQSGTVAYPQKKEKEITSKTPPPPQSGGGGEDSTSETDSPIQPEPTRQPDPITVRILREAKVSAAARREVGHVPGWVAERIMADLRTQRGLRSPGGALVAELRAWLAEQGDDDERRTRPVGSGGGGGSNLEASDPEPELTDEDIAEIGRQALERLWPSAVYASG